MEAAVEPRQLEFLRRKDRKEERESSPGFRESSRALLSHAASAVSASPARSLSLSFFFANPRANAFFSADSLAAERESNSPACLRQLRGPETRRYHRRAAGRKKEGQREKPKARGREQGKRRVHVCVCVCVCV